VLVEATVCRACPELAAGARFTPTAAPCPPLPAAAATTDLEVRDGKSNTPLLLAYRLGRTKAARMLLAAGSDPKARTPEGFEAIHVAALTGNPDLVREAVLAYLAETDAAFERRLPSLQDALASMPDFELRMHWEFASWIPLVSRLLPSDTFTIYKRGTSLRLDSTLLAMNGLSWERGALSLLVLGRECGPHAGRSFVLDHDMKTAADARLAFTAPEDQSQQDWVRKLLTTKIKSTDYWSRDARFVPLLKRGFASGGAGGGGLLGSLTRGVSNLLLGGGDGGKTPTPRGRVSDPSAASPVGLPSPTIDDGSSSPSPNDVVAGSDAAEDQAEEPASLVRADVGVWTACGVYELQNLCVRDITHPPVLPEASLPLKAWWKPEYSRQKAGDAAAEAGAGSSNSSSGVTSPTSATADHSSSSAAGSGAGSGGGAQLVDDVPEAKLGLLKRALRAIREGRIDELAGTRDAGELEGMWFGEGAAAASGPDSGSGSKDGGSGRKPGYAVAHYSFNEYFGHARGPPPPPKPVEPPHVGTGPRRTRGGPTPPPGPDAYVHADGKLHRPQAAVGEFKPAHLASEDKVLDLKMAFSRDFPITVRARGGGPGVFWAGAPTAYGPCRLFLTPPPAIAPSLPPCSTASATATAARAVPAHRGGHGTHRAPRRQLPRVL
jgi:hypothetical protein